MGHLDCGYPTSGQAPSPFPVALAIEDRACEAKPAILQQPAAVSESTVQKYILSRASCTLLRQQRFRQPAKYSACLILCSHWIAKPLWGFFPRQLRARERSEV